MTVYVDVIFLENLVINYIILYTTGMISKSKIKYIRILFGSIIGAIYSIIYYLLNISLYSNLILKIILSIIMVYVSFNTKTSKILFKQVLLFYLTSFVFAGASLGIIYMVNSQDITIQNGILIGSYTMRTILVGIIIAYITIIIAFSIIKTKITKKDLFCTITVCINNNEIHTKAMIDTGNLLKDPLSGLPVIVLEHILLYDALPKEILNNIDSILGGDLSKVPIELQNQYMPKLKVIPFSSLGKQNGMLLGIRADYLKINYEEDIIFNDKIIVGIYTKSLTKRGEYQSLLGIDFLK